MAQFEVDKEIDGQIDKIWAVVEQFGECAWIPGIESCELVGDGIGAIRQLKMGGMEIHERLEACDPAAKTLSYSITQGPMPTENYLATIKLSEAGPGRVRVQWGAKFDTPGMNDEQATGLAQGVAGSYSGMVDALAKAVA